MWKYNDDGVFIDTGPEGIFWVLFNMVPGLGIRRMMSLRRFFGTLRQAWEAPASQLRMTPGIPDKVIDNIIEHRSTVEIDRELDRARNAGARIVTLDSPSYPANLKHIHDPPPVLYIIGDLSQRDDAACAIVGTRRASPYGEGVAFRFARDLSSSGITIVSGMALGIDSAAHKGALAAGGRTVAVLGSGVDVVYPPENHDLYKEIALKGAVLSEFPMGTLPQRGNFPCRNRIISGLALACLVVEARDRSGALVTCGFAAEQGRPVFAVPGDIRRPQAAGPNKLIRDGASPALDIEEIRETIEAEVGRVLRPAGPQSRTSDTKMIEKPLGPSASMGLSGNQKLILDVLEYEPMTRDEIIERTGANASDVASALIDLELSGIIRSLPGDSFMRHEEDPFQRS